MIRCFLQQQLLRSDSLFQTWNYSARNPHRFRVSLFLPPIKSSSGGKSKERSLSFHITQNEKVAICRCFNFEYGWAGHVLADVDPAEDGVNKVNIPSQLSEERLRLKPLGDELIDYFAKRMISAETLHKNGVMMQMVDDKKVIAFTYRRNGELVKCKFRSITKKEFWQAKHGRSILYGLDDIKEGHDIVIVEGEIDKLSMDEAGILNCVSVPDGAPQKLSNARIPSEKQEANFKYLSDCNGHLDKASRIILATDADKPGQALAEELSRRLGKERCWVVKWPKKDELSCYKDANEVLVYLGAEALRRIVETAELYQVLEHVGPKQLSEEMLRLEPLGDELTDYFAKRMISAETLHKNDVMQLVDDKNVIAYTYRRNGELVGCKFQRITNRKFWQAKHGKRILYGLDDIKEGNDIVIVETEIDKLSMEEAGILNCVSLPECAPQKVSTVRIPSKKQEARFKYLTDCNGHLDKASRIILATNGDGPGQALAEVLGKERCWIVTWPKKDELSCYKDANEVLVHLGAEALRRIVETAELYQVKN
ncbi:uncharacterized protein [Rutidosis leptorrhynchoides]|uniref:uncharacterized protein isoform X2 n=1 Tax=Rutidosis leptorrhynchoides TaxID=125765 RepID=UPI003A994511